MKLLDFIPIKLTLFLITGIILGNYLHLRPLIPLLGVAISLCSLGFLFYHSDQQSDISFGLVAACTTLTIGIFSASLALPENNASHYSHRMETAKTSCHLKVREVLKPNPFTEQYVAEIQRIGVSPVTGKLLLSIPKDAHPARLEVDDEIIVRGSPDEITPPRNPHQFKYREYMAARGVYHQIRVEGREYNRKPTKNKSIHGIAANIRNHIRDNLKKAGFEKDELGVIEALLLGERNDISTETYNNYKNAGAVHILAVSGLHIGVLLLLLQYLLQPLEFLPKGKTIKLMVIVGLLWCFAFLAGLSASVVRAVTMFSFVAYALYLNRPSNTFNIIALSMFFILLVINPMFLFQVGFQMSYSAVLAIVWIYPKLQRFWFPENVLLRKFWQLLSVSFAAQLGVLPVSLFYFHQFPGLFFLSNLLVVPFLGLILGLGIVVIALALLNTLPNTMVSLYSDIIKLMNASVGWVAQQEDFIFKNIPFDSMQLLLAYIFIFALVYALSKITFKRLALLLSAIVCFQVWLLFLKFNAGKQEKVILLHQTANTVLFYQKGMTLNIHTSDPARVDRLAIDYKVAEYIAEISFQGIDNSYKIAERKLLILDSSGIYPANHRTDILLLTQSPKINLIRILDALRPKQIVADGSNYTAYVNRWRQTCLQKKLPFHYTGEKGAYYFSFR